MKIVQRHWKTILLVFSGALIAFLILSYSLPKAKPLVGSEVKSSKTTGTTKTTISLVALGDSLTEGVGDTTNSGGFVPIIARDIKDEYNLVQVNTTNYGKAGDRSDQILKRLNASKKSQNKLKKADVITLTVGGNDLMKVIRSELMNDITTETFAKPQINYQQNLRKLYKRIREINATAPIYQLGIYNPFYINFSELEDMQKIVDSWNAASQEVTKEQSKSYFIPINDLIYKGINGNIGVGDETTASSTGTSSSQANNLISESDNFHPNNLGYQIMSNALKEEMIKTKQQWLNKK